jgi:hypothetical protein
LAAEPCPHDRGIVGQIDLVQDQKVGRLELAQYRIADTPIDSTSLHVICVDDDDDAVTMETRLEGGEIGNSGWIGDAGRFDNDMIELIRALEQGEQRRHQRITDTAAQAAVGKRDRAAAMFGDQLAVDIERTEIVDEDGEPPARRTGQQPVD